jgi:hypothetical protein
MASIPTQEEILTATRKSQEAMIAAVKTWLETVRTATPKLSAVYAPLTGKLPRLPSVSLPFADKLPTPTDAVASAYDLAEQLLVSQRRFAEELVKAMTPLVPGRSESSPQTPSRSARPKAVVTDAEPKTVVTGPAPASPAPAAAGPAAKSTPARPAAKSTPARTAAKSTPARTAAKSTTARPAAKRTSSGSAGKSTPDPKSAN